VKIGPEIRGGFRAVKINDQEDQIMDFYKSIFKAIDGVEKLSAKCITEFVKKKSCTGLGGFVDLNNDLGYMVEKLQINDPGIYMPYFYARRGAAAGMFAQGAFDKQAFDRVDSLFFIFMAQIGTKLTRDEQINFQEESLDSALELESKYYAGINRKSTSLLIGAAKKGISICAALLNALEYDKHDKEALKSIIAPVMCADWVMKAEFCMGFFATGAWEQDFDLEMTSRRVLKYFASIGMPFVLKDKNIFNAEDVVKKSDLVKRIEKDGIEYVTRHFTEKILNKLKTKDIAYQFVLEEVEAASQGSDAAIRFAKDSGIGENEYRGSIKKSRIEVDGPDGPQQTLLRICSQLVSNKDLMVELRIRIVDNIMKAFFLGKYEYENQQIFFKGGMRLEDAEVDILFIIKNNKVKYINNEANNLYIVDNDKEKKLDGRVVVFEFTGQSDNSVIEVFVAFSDADSYTLFTLQVGMVERLTYVAQAIFKYFSDYSIKNIFSPVEVYSTQYVYTFKLYCRCQKYFMINNTQTQAYLIDKAGIERDDVEEIKNAFWGNNNSET
jgi:hypothetical protein